MKGLRIFSRRASLTAILAMIAVQMCQAGGTCGTPPLAFSSPSNSDVKRCGCEWILVASVSIALTTTPVQAGAEPDLANGATLFQANCAGCHAGGQNFVAEKKTLRKEALEKFQSLDAEKLQSFVQKGMPHKFLPFSGKLSDDDYRDVTNYVLDQALGDKW